MQRSNAARIIQRLNGEEAGSLEAATRDFAARLKRNFSQEIARNPRDFKKQVLRLARGGRSRSPAIQIPRCE